MIGAGFLGRRPCLVLMVLLVYVGVVIYDVYAKVQIRGQGRQTCHHSPCLFCVASSIRWCLLPGDPCGAWGQLCS